MITQQSSPCSTFKIISTLIGLDEKVITSEASTMGYDGTLYQRENWNQELSLKEAFEYSCVWYFRKLIDQVGEAKLQESIEELDYGNHDISEWEGSAINSYPRLNGFWIESSLKISPLEQIKVLTDIFEGRTKYSEEDIAILKSIMLTTERESSSIYGKTGTGINCNGWFVGFMDKFDDRIYFAVYLEDENNEEITGLTAREIATQILDEEYSDQAE